MGRKQSNLVVMTKPQFDRYLLDTKAIMQQQTLDCLVLALAETFGFGPDRFGRLRESFEAKWSEMCALAKADVKADKEIAYTKAVIDRALLQAVGPEHFRPWEERYDSTTE